MGVLGNFDVSLFGRVSALRDDLTTHEADANPHGATSAATGSTLMYRDASGYSRVIAPATSDDSSRIATTSWVTDKISAASGTVTQVLAGAGLSVTPTGDGQSVYTVSVDNVITAGSFTSANITVNARGQVTAASNGGAGVSSVGATAPVATSGGSTPTISMAAATSGNHGYMTSTYATKLNGIATGAQVNTVTQVFGRTGNVVAVANDYNITEIDGITISTSGPSGGSDGDLWFEY